MKIAIIITVGLAVLVLGEWAYRGFLRPIDPLSKEVQALSKFLNERGVEGAPYAVRHGFGHSYILSSAAFKIKDYPLPIAIAVYPSSVIAGKSALSNIGHMAIYNDNLAISFPAWGDDTEQLQSKIVSAFYDFKK